MALEAGLGIIVVGSDVQLLQQAVTVVHSLELRKKLITKVQAKAGAWECLRPSLTI